MEQIKVSDYLRERALSTINDLEEEKAEEKLIKGSESFFVSKKFEEKENRVLLDVFEVVDGDEKFFLFQKK